MNNNKSKRPSAADLTPSIMADIAVKALKSGNTQQIADEYGIKVDIVCHLQDVLERNAEDLFLPGIQDKSLYRIFSDIRGQINLIKHLVNDASEVIGIKNGSYFSE
jgi:hypothetical protein